jgi:hypothetical protein
VDTNAAPRRHPLLALFASHWLAQTGLGLVLTAIISWACLLPAQLRHGDDNPYIGIATALVGGLFVLGLVLTPLGLHLGRKRLSERISASLQDARTPGGACCSSWSASRWSTC